LRLKFFKRAMVLGASTAIVATIAACSSGTSLPDDGPEIGSKSPGEIQDSGEVENTVTDVGEDEASTVEDPESAGILGVPEFDVDSYAEINPAPVLLEVIREANLRGEFENYEDYRIPRDAIVPIYSPRFVPPDEATLRPKELVMGLEINGDARAYPVGMLRTREIVNDEVGGTPVLVTW
jgi:hypothetical protein